MELQSGEEAGISGEEREDETKKGAAAFRCESSQGESRRRSAPRHAAMDSLASVNFPPPIPSLHSSEASFRKTEVLLEWLQDTDVPDEHFFATILGNQRIFSPPSGKLAIRLREEIGQEYVEAWGMSGMDTQLGGCGGKA